MEFCITAENLTAGYNGVPAFKDINLKIQKEKITTLIGYNGSGKSTILKTMSRLIVPTGRSVCLGGESIYNMPTKTVAQKLALLPQGAQIPIGITVKDLVEYGRFPYKNKFSGNTVQDKEIIRWDLSDTNMTKLSDKEMDKLSGGQR